MQPLQTPVIEAFRRTIKPVVWKGTEAFYVVVILCVTEWEVWVQAVRDDG